MSKAIAQITHEANRAYCESIGDFSQKPWAKAAQWQRDSAIEGVKRVIFNPKITPQRLHESWMQHKAAEGWKYGPVKDEKKKEHPCMVPYEQLPLEQRRKDTLFRAIVKALAA